MVPGNIGIRHDQVFEFVELQIIRVDAPSDDGQRILTNEIPPTGQDKTGARLIQNWVAGVGG